MIEETVNGLQSSVHSLQTRIQDHFAGWNMDDVIKQVEEEREKKRLEDIARRKKAGRKNSSKPENVDPSTVVSSGKLLTVSVPGFGSFKCSLSSTKDLDSLDSFDYCKSQGLVLQSAGQTVVVRKYFFDATKDDKNFDIDHSDEYQKLSTLALGYNDGSRIVRVFAEINMSEESRELLRTGLDAHKKGEELFLSMTDSLVSRLLSSGRRTSPLETNPLSCSVEEKSNGSDYSRDKFNIALFGSSDLAEVNASYLRARGKTQGFSYDYTREQLEELLKSKDGMVHVRPCSLGGGNCSSIDDVNADGNFNVSGRARGFTCVEQKIFGRKTK